MAIVILATVGAAVACRQPAARAQNSTPIDSPVVKQVVESAVEQTRHTTGYDPSYVRLDYPGGDVPIETGVCADVIIRAFREAGVDLQKQIHEDMTRSFSEYPQLWGAKKPDSNIDHRRVPNLMTFFKRKDRVMPLSNKAEDYLPGDVVAWDLGGGVTHIGIVTNIVSDTPKRFKIAHNIGAGARVEDVLFDWKVIGHYRFF